MSIAYNYTIARVDEPAKTMEILYTAPGYPDQYMGVPLPPEGSDLEAVIQFYAPIAFWTNVAAPVLVPTVGVAGQLTSIDPPTPSADELAKQTRQNLLAQTDWTQLPDVPMDDRKRTAWLQYRQALRDITAQAGFPDSIQWPEQPL